MSISVMVVVSSSANHVMALTNGGRRSVGAFMRSWLCLPPGLNASSRVMTGFPEVSQLVCRANGAT